MIRANFSAYSTYVTDSLHQWDINQTLTVTGLNLTDAPEVHFANSNMDRAVVRRAIMNDHAISVDIPNSLLQDALIIKAHVGIYEGDAFKVIELIEIPVIPRKRPLDYVLEASDDEVYSFNALEYKVDKAKQAYDEAKDACDEAKGAYDEAVDKIDETLKALSTSRIAYGTYVGTGDFGPNKPNKVHADFDIKVVLLAESGLIGTNDTTISARCLFGQTSFASGYSSRQATSMWEQGEFSWYADNARSQYNIEGATYVYVLLG